MNNDWKVALSQYDAHINDAGRIVRKGTMYGVRVHQHRGRLRFEAVASGSLLCSGPVAACTVERFVESFWMWKKENAA